MITGNVGRSYKYNDIPINKYTLGEAIHWVDAKLLSVPTNDSLSY